MGRNGDNAVGQILLLSFRTARESRSGNIVLKIKKSSRQRSQHALDIAISLRKLCLGELCSVNIEDLETLNTHMILRQCQQRRKDGFILKPASKDSLTLPSLRFAVEVLLDLRLK